MHWRFSIISLVLATLLALSVATAAPAQGEEKSNPEFEGDEEIFYVIGVMLSQNIETFRASESEIAAVERGIKDGLTGANSDINVEAYQTRIQTLKRKRSQLAAADESKASIAFLEAQAKEPGAKKLPSGLIITEIVAGSGAAPKMSDKVKVHYHGTLRTGKVFDSSVQRGEPAVFPLNRVIPCWTEGVSMMKAGGKARLVCPSSIAYGDRGTQGIPGGAALVFEVELIEVMGQPGGK